MHIPYTCIPTRDGQHDDDTDDRRKEQEEEKKEKAKEEEEEEEEEDEDDEEHKHAVLSKWACNGPFDLGPTWALSCCGRAIARGPVLDSIDNQLDPFLFP